MTEQEHDKTQQQADQASEEAVNEETAAAGEEPVAKEEPAVQDRDASVGDDAPSAEEQVESLQKRLAEVEKALAEADIRAQAEIQNMRRRLDRDLENAHKFALEKFAKDILSVADSLERGLASLDQENEELKPAVEGTELTLKVLLDVFGRFNIEQIDPIGQPFNPEEHEAMTMVPNPEMEPNTVMDVLEKGYTLNGRLVRPARVVVVKGS